MNRKALSFVLFVVAFIATYLFICFCIPGMRIKLEAEPLEYFLASVTYMMLFKSVISLIVGLIVGAFTLFAGRTK